MKCSHKECAEVGVYFIFVTKQGLVNALIYATCRRHFGGMVQAMRDEGPVRIYGADVAGPAVDRQLRTM